MAFLADELAAVAVAEGMAEGDVVHLLVPPGLPPPPIQPTVGGGVLAYTGTLLSTAQIAEQDVAFQNLLEEEILRNSHAIHAQLLVTTATPTFSDSLHKGTWEAVKGNLCALGFVLNTDCHWAKLGIFREGAAPPDYALLERRCYLASMLL
jgi:hypothetical protein